MSFKVGDKVLCVDGVPSDGLISDTTYTVVDLSSKNGLLKVSGSKWWWRPDRFRLANSQAPETIQTMFEDDNVYHPPHYARWKMEPIEFIMINDLPGWLANVIKYTMRYDAKNGLEDLYKGRSYLDMKIRQLEGIPRFWEKPVSEERRLNNREAA